MLTIGKESTLVLLALVLTTACGQGAGWVCLISCADGFTTTQEGKCDSSTLTSLGAVHGGSCKGTDHVARATTEPREGAWFAAAIHPKAKWPTPMPESGIPGSASTA
jgi:hypothetical protein